MMKKYFFILMMCACSLGIAAQKTLTILHTNDSHSCIYPLNPNLADTALAGRGGYLRRINMIKQERAKAPKLLLIDSGDFSQGSPYYSLYKGDVEVKLMNMMGYDVATIGNHEFDFGLENMARIFKMANFPIVCSNYDFTGTPLEGIVKPYTIIKRDGVRIGIFAICPKMEGLVATENYGAIKYLDPSVETNRMTDLLRNKKKCDLVICVSHMGWNNLGENDQLIIPKTHGIDLVLGGHSHTYFEEMKYVKDADGRDVPVDQNGKHAIWVGKIVLNMDKK